MPDDQAAPTPGSPIQDDAGSPGIVRDEESGEVHLIYKVEGKSDEVPAFELSRALEALGNIIHEGDKVINGDKHDVLVRVKPFQEGSFVMDLVLSIQNNPTLLFFLAHPEATERIKKLLEYIGLIKKGNEILHSVLDVIEHLKSGKPERVEPAGHDVFNYYNESGQVMPVSQPIHNLVNNGTIQQFIFPQKSDMPALKAYSEPPSTALREEVVENETTAFVNPKAGTYGDTDGVWTFTPAGTSRDAFRARITDEVFLTKYRRGAIRFYRDDILKVRLKTQQRVRNGKSKFTYEIVEVLDYKSAPVKRTRRLL
jgi:hypothetical protein